MIVLYYSITKYLLLILYYKSYVGKTAIALVKICYLIWRWISYLIKYIIQLCNTNILDNWLIASIFQLFSVWVCELVIELKLWMDIHIISSCWVDPSVFGCRLNQHKTVEKCKMLPLRIKSLRKHSLELSYWNHMKNSKILPMPNYINQILLNIENSPSQQWT